MSVYQPRGFKKLFHFSKRSLAKMWLSRMHPIQIAITGSQGKTGTTEIVTKLLESIGPTVRTDKNLDTTFNVPLTALRVGPSTKFLVWELGIDHPGEMDRHLEIARPTIGIVTGISPVHTDEEHMGSMKRLIEEKRRILEVLPESGHAILNYDDPHVRSMAEHTHARIHWYGTDPTQTEVYSDPDLLHIDLSGTSATIYDKELKKNLSLHTPLIGTHHVLNLMGSYIAFKLVNHEPDCIERFTEIVSKISPLIGRMNIQDGPLETTILNDSLRANPASTMAGLATLEKIEYTNGRKIVVIGEMGELEKPEEEHRKTGAYLASLHLDFVLCIGPLRKYTIDEALKHGYSKDHIAYAENVFQAAEILKKILRKGDLWYLKGSLLRNYKRIIQLLNNEEVCCDAIMCPYDHCGYPDR